MYTDFYNLDGRPFQLSPNHRFFFGTRSHRRAMAYITYGLHQGEGFLVVTGDVGTGKTTLSSYLAEQLQSERFLVARLSLPTRDSEDLVRQAAHAFGVDPRDASKASLLGLIENFLLERLRAKQRVLLIIDEVQNAPPESLDELRMLASLQSNGRALFQMLLIGQPQFKETLTVPALEQLRQRVVASYHLSPLGLEETRDYIEHRLARVGWRHDPSFDDEAIARIHEYSGGVPRRINMLCARLLVYGALEHRHSLALGDVDEVIAELEQEHTGGTSDEGIVGARGLTGEGAHGSPWARGADLSESETMRRAGLQFNQAALGLAEGRSLTWSEQNPTEEEYRREVERLQRKLEGAYEELLDEKRRCDSLRNELETLRSELHHHELERLRSEAEASRRVVEMLGQMDPESAANVAGEALPTSPPPSGFFRRLVGSRS